MDLLPARVKVTLMVNQRKREEKNPYTIRPTMESINVYFHVQKAVIPSLSLFIVELSEI